MKLILLILACLVLVTSAHAKTTSKSDPPPWKTYTVADEQFSVALPTLPAMHFSNHFVDRVRKYRSEWRLGSYADGVVYMIFVFENPKPRQTLAEFMAELDYDAKLGSERNVTRDGVRGIERSRSYGMVQFYVTENRLYKFEAFALSADNPGIAKFFSSISLTRKKGSSEVLDGPGEPYEPAVEPQANGEEAQKIYTGREVTQKIRLGMKPEPSYTESARLNAVTGTVVLKCVFASNGTVTNIRTFSGLPNGLTEKAIDAARKIKFIPAIKDGKYVSMWMQLEYNFNLF